MSKGCCKECVPPKRHPGCHDTCESYQKEKAERDAEKALIEKEKKKLLDIDGYYFDRERRVRKHFGRK